MELDTHVIHLFLNRAIKHNACAEIDHDQFDNDQIMLFTDRIEFYSQTEHALQPSEIVHVFKLDQFEYRGAGHFRVNGHEIGFFEEVLMKL